MSYEQAIDGEWFHIPKVGMDIQCCDCGLVHKVKFKKKNNRLYLSFVRKDRATAQIRRHKKESHALLSP